MRKFAAVVIALALAAPLVARAQDVAEPTTKVKFAVKSGDMSLLGVGLRIRKIAFISAKVYAIGLYVSDATLAGRLAAYKGKTSTPEFYNELIWGDFPKQVTLKFTRDLGQGRIQNAMREALEGADKSKTDAFVSYFPEIKTGQECVIRWAPGGTLETKMAGTVKPPIADKNFAAAVFGIWLRDKPIQEDIKLALVSRAGEVIK